MKGELSKIGDQRHSLSFIEAAGKAVLNPALLTEYAAAAATASFVAVMRLMNQPLWAVALAFPGTLFIMALINHCLLAIRLRR